VKNIFINADKLATTGEGDCFQGGGIHEGATFNRGNTRWYGETG
jgi:hypothetical protein